MASSTITIDLASTLQTDANPMNVQKSVHEFVQNKQTYYKKMLSNQRTGYTQLNTNDSSIPIDRDRVLTIVDKDLLLNDTKIATLGDLSVSNITKIGEAFSLSGYYNGGLHYTRVVNTSNVYTFYVDDDQINFPAGQILTGTAYNEYLMAIYAADTSRQRIVVYNAKTKVFKNAYSDITQGTKRAFSPNETDTVFTKDLTSTKFLKFNLNDDAFFQPNANETFVVVGKRYNYTNTLSIYTDGEVASVDAIHSMYLKFTADPNDQDSNIYCPWGKLQGHDNQFFDYCPELVKSINNKPLVYIGMLLTPNDYLINKLEWNPDFPIEPDDLDNNTYENPTWTVGFNTVTLSGVTVGLNCVASPKTDGSGEVQFPTNLRLRTDILLATNICDLLHIDEDGNSIEIDANGQPNNYYTYQSISSLEDGTKSYHGLFSGLTYTDASESAGTKQTITYDSDWMINSSLDTFKTANWSQNKPLYLLTYGDNAYNVLCYNGCMLTTPGLFDPEVYPTIINTGEKIIVLYSDENNNNWWIQELDAEYRIDKVNIDMYKVNDTNGTVIVIGETNVIIETNNQQAPFYLIRDMDNPSLSYGPASFTASLVYANAGINIALTGDDRCISFNDGLHFWALYNPRVNADGTFTKAVSASQVNTINKNGASYLVPMMLYDIIDRQITVDLFVTVANGTTLDLSTTPMYLKSFSQSGIDISSFYKARLSNVPYTPALDATGTPILYSQLPPGAEYINNGTIETLGQFGDERYIMRTIDNKAMMFTTEYSKVFANGLYFTLFGQSYLYDNNNIMIVDVDADGLVNLGYILSYCANLVFLGTNNIKAYFYRPYDESIYSFNGGRDLVKEKEWSGASAPSQVLWDSSANTLYWYSDTDNMTYAYRNGIISEVGKFPKLYMTLDGLATVENGIHLINRIVDGEVIEPFIIQTGVIGQGPNKLSKFERVDVRLFDLEKKNVKINIITSVINTDTQKDKVFELNVNSVDYDNFGYCYVKVVPPNAEGVGIQISITSDDLINLETLSLELEDTGHKIQVLEKMSG